MSELKTTPGPWSVQKAESGGLLIKPVPGQVIAQCDELPEMEENAHLIAAAPALYEALEECLSRCSMYEDFEFYRHAQSALAAARGKA